MNPSPKCHLAEFQVHSLQSAVTAPAAQLHHMQVGEQPKSSILDCPLSSVSRSKNGKCRRMEEIARDTVHVLVVAAGSLRYLHPVNLVLFDCPVKTTDSFRGFLI